MTDKTDEAIEKTITTFHCQYVGLDGVDEYNAVLMHISDLIVSSYVLFKNEKYSTSLFLTITVLEEIAKIHVGGMRNKGRKGAEVKRGKDPLFNHNKKHLLAFFAIELIENDIAKKIGIERTKAIISGYRSGEYTALREKCLYFYKEKNSSLHIPANQIDVKAAAEQLIISIMIFVENFWGITNEASKICDAVEQYLDELVNAI